MALDQRNYCQVVETTVKLAQKSGVLRDCGRIVNDLKDEVEPYHKMVMETIAKVVAMLGASDIDECLEVCLVDGIIYAFQEQMTENQVILDVFGTVINALGIGMKPYLTQIVSTILWRLNSKSAEVRQQASLIRLSITMSMTHALTNCNTCFPAGNHYKVYPQPELPGADCFLWLMLWICWLKQVHYQCPLAPDDPIFPAMGANGIVQPCLAVSSDTVQQWINEATMGAGISGSFLTHCFWRRGAQYHFILGRAGWCWSLKKSTGGAAGPRGRT